MYSKQNYFGVETNRSDIQEFMAMKRWSFERMIKPVLDKTKLPAGSRVLDVGCGLGALLDVMNGRSFDGYGVEVGQGSAAFTSQRYPNRVHAGTVESAGYPDGFFDLVTMFDVIEHLEDPVVTLTEVKRILAPNGWLYVMTPNIYSINSQLMRSRWYQYKPHEHLFYFSPRSLTVALKRCGFSKTNLWSTGIYTSIGRITLVTKRTNPQLNRALTMMNRLQLNRVNLWIPSGHLSALAM
jgi:SAM-dependent methyltransferase